MKIGVFLGDKSSTIGGEYTFESEVLRCLIEFGAKSGHTFVVFSFTKEQHQEILAEHLQFISVESSLKESRTSKIFAIAVGVLKKLQRPEGQLKIKDRLEQFTLNSILNNQIDLIWCLSPWICPTMEIPYIIVVWDLQHRLQPYFPEVSTEGQWNVRESTYGVRLRRASAIITGSETGKAEIERFYQVPAENVKVLPLPTPRFALDAPQNDEKQVLIKYNLPENYLFYPAQFWPHKNHVGLLLAVQLLRDKYDLIFPVVFVGSDKGNQPYIKQLVAELDLMTQVYFLGFVPQLDLVSLYRSAFALIFTSFFGPDNLPPLEAFALSCPVVASNVSGTQEQLGNAALLVDPREPKQIATAIKSLHEDSSLRQMLIQRGLERASKWTGQDYVKGVLSIFDDFETIRRCWSSKEPHYQV